MNHAWTEPKRHPDCSEPCVSDLALDQLFCEELSDNDAQALKTRISACAGCQVRWDERSQGLKAFSELDADALVAKIHVGLAETSPLPKPTSESWLTWLFGVKWVGAAAIAMLAVVFIFPEIEPKTTGDTDVLRAKGDTSAVVLYRERDGNVDLLSEGAKAREGDRIQFELKGLEAGFVVIVGNEATGTLYRLLNPEQVQASLEAPYLIPKAFELDGSLGVETFTVYHCALNASQGAPFNGEPVDGCQTFAAQVEKVGP